MNHARLFERTRTSSRIRVVSLASIRSTVRSCDASRSATSVARRTVHRADSATFARRTAMEPSRHREKTAARKNVSLRIPYPTLSKAALAPLYVRTH